MYQNYITLASYNSDTNEIEWFKNFKIQLPEMTEEVKTFWDALEKDPDVKITNERSFLEIADDLGVADNTFKDFIKTTKESGTVYKTSEEALAGYQSYLQSTGKSLTLADIKTKALSASMKVLSTLGWMALFAGISWAIGKAVEGIDHLINHEKYAQKALESALETSKKFKDSISNTREELNKTKKSVSEIASEYAKLSQGVDIYTNENISLTNEQYEEFVSLNNQLAELFPSLTRNYDENGNAILGLGGSVESVTDKIRTLIEQQERLATIEMRKSLEGYVNGDEDGNGGQIEVLKGLEDNLEKAENELIKFKEKYDAILNGKQVDEDFLNKKQLEKAKDYYKNAFGLTEEELKKSTVLKRNFLGEGVYRLDFENLEIDESRKEEILEFYNSFYKELNDDILYAQSELDTANKEMSNMMMMWVEDESLYKDGGNTFQTLIQSMIEGIDWNQLGIENYDDAKTWIKDNIFHPISSVDGDDKNILTDAIDNLLSLDLNNFPIDKVKEKIDKYLATIAEILGQESADKLKVNLGFDYVDTLVNNVKGKLQDSFDDKVGELSLEDLEIAANKLEIDPSVPISWDELIAKIEEYKAKLKEDNETPIFSLTEAQSTAIDDFQSKIKILGDTLSSLKAGEDISFTDLVQEFPELQGRSENLEQAIQSLIYDALQNLYDLLGEGLPDDLRQDLQSIADSASEVTVPLDKALSSIQKSFDAVSDFKSVMSSGIMTSSALSNIASISGELSNMVAGYYAGVTSASDLYTALSDHYDNDLKNYTNALIAKNGTSESFYNSLGLSSADVINQFASDYGIDISNCKNYNEAKLEIEKQTLLTVSNMWSKYYNAQTKSFTSDMEAMGRAAETLAKQGVPDKDNQYLQFARQLGDQVRTYQDAMSQLDNITYSGVQSNFEKISSGISNSTSSVTDNSKDLIDAYMNYMEKSLDSGKIDYNTYCNTVKNYLNDMYKSGKISAQDYFDYQAQILEKQKDIYDKVLSAVLRRFDKEIDKINESIDSIEKQNEALEKQKDEYDKILSAIDKVYESQIEDLEKQQGLIQDQIDALNEEADAYDLIRRREDALYAIRRAEEQRTKYVYSGDEKGFIYTIDSDAYREAQDELSGIKREETISALEKEQDKLQESIDLLQQYRDMWANITSAYDEEIAKQLALSMYGKDFEQIILQNRLSDIESFKGNYLLIQHQIDDNSSMIASYNEKIAYYEGLKQQWSALSSAYSESVEDQYAAQILGADWEKLIIDGRLTTLNDFKNEYIKIQQEMADAAWKSTNEQIRAAQEAKKAAEGVPSTAVKISDNTTSKSVKEHGYAVLNTKTKSEVKRGFKTEQEAIAYIESKSGTLQKQLTVTRYKHGGVVTSSAHDDLFDKLAKRIGEHHMVAVRDGERILTPKQNKTYEEMIKFAKSRINTTFPASIRNMDHNKITNINSSSTPIVQEITLNLPNVNNQNAANEIMKALRQLPGDALQYAHRRR